MEDQPHAAAAGGTHLDHLALALGQLLHDDAGVLLVDVDDHLLDRLEQLAGRPVLKQDLRPRHGELEAFAAHGLDEDAELQFAAAGDLHRILLRRFRKSRSATLPSASRNSRSRMTRLCTLSPSVPASGESLMRKVMAKVGGSIGCAGAARSLPARRACATTVASGRPAMETMSPANASSIGVRSRPRKASTLVTRPSSISVAVAVEHLDRLVRLDRAGGDAAGDDAAEIGIGLEDGAEHAERAVLDRRRRDVRERPGRTAAPCPCPSGRRARPPSSPAWPSRRGSGSRAALRWRRAPRTGRRPRWRPRWAGRPAGRPC